VVKSKVKKEPIDKEEVVQDYKSLSQVERTFRMMKTVRPELRPIYHRKADRVRAHAFICLLVYYVPFAFRRRLRPLLAGNEKRGKLLMDRKRGSGKTAKD